MCLSGVLPGVLSADLSAIARRATVEAGRPHIRAIIRPFGCYLAQIRLRRAHEKRFTAKAQRTQRTAGLNLGRPSKFKPVRIAFGEAVH